MTEFNTVRRTAIEECNKVKILELSETSTENELQEIRFVEKVTFCVRIIAR